MEIVQQLQLGAHVGAVVVKVLLRKRDRQQRAIAHEHVLGAAQRLEFVAVEVEANEVDARQAEFDDDIVEAPHGDDFTSARDRAASPVQRRGRVGQHRSAFAVNIREPERHHRRALLQAVLNEVALQFAAVAGDRLERDDAALRPRPLRQQQREPADVSADVQHDHVGLNGREQQPRGCRCKHPLLAHRATEPRGRIDRPLKTKTLRILPSLGDRSPFVRCRLHTSGAIGAMAPTT